MDKIKLIHVGTFGSPIGLKGEIKINMLTTSFEFFKKLNYYVNEDSSTEWIFNKMRFQNKKLIAHPVICKNFNDSKKLVGTKIFTLQKYFPRIKKNEYYAKDLIDCDVFYLNKKNKIGIVTGLNNFGAGDLLEIIPKLTDNL